MLHEFITAYRDPIITRTREKLTDRPWPLVSTSEMEHGVPPFAHRRRTDRTGLGLGLSIARKAVKMHGGDINFRNVPGQGCVFVIDVPLAPAEASVAQR